MAVEYWHDIEKTIPAQMGMTVAVVTGIFVENGKPVDAVAGSPEKRPTLGPFGLNWPGTVLKTGIVITPPDGQQPGGVVAQGGEG